MRDRAAVLIASGLFFIAGAILVHAGVTVQSREAENCFGWGIAIMIAAGIMAIGGMVNRIREANRKFDAANGENSG